MKNLKTTITAGLYFLSVILKQIGIEIPQNILLDFQAIIIFALGYFAQDSTKNENVKEAPKEETQK